MYVLPAIDIRGGKVVRLTRGDYGQEERYDSLLQQNKLLFTVDLIKEKLSDAYRDTD